MIPYVIFEMQTDREGNTAHLPPVDKTDENAAYAEYYLKLSYAYNSDVYMHTVMLCTADGRRIDGKCIMHNVNGITEVETNE